MAAWIGNCLRFPNLVSYLMYLKFNNSTKKKSYYLTTLICSHVVTQN